MHSFATSEVNSLLMGGCSHDVTMMISHEYLEKALIAILSMERANSLLTLLMLVTEACLETRNLL